MAENREEYVRNLKEEIKDLKEQLEALENEKKSVIANLPNSSGLSKFPEDLESLKLIEEFYKLCGISVESHTDLHTTVALHTSYKNKQQETYRLTIKTEEKGNSVVEAFLPNFISSAELEMQEGSSTVDFIKKIRTLLTSYVARREQVEELKASKPEYKIEHTTDFTGVNIVVPIPGSLNGELSIVLSYHKNKVFPDEVKMETEDLTTEGLEALCVSVRSVFPRYFLSDAVKAALDYFSP